MVKSQIVSVSIPFYGLEDLIVGKVPTFSGWNVNPTDAADCTDNDPSTSMTTGNKVLGAGFQYCYLTFDLGIVQKVMISGFGEVQTTAGNGYMYVEAYNDGAWDRGYLTLCRSGYGDKSPIPVCFAWGSRIRFSLTASVAATITPNIHELNIWRMQ